MPPTHPILSLIVAACAASTLTGLAADREGAPAPFKKPLITSDLGGRELAFLTKANEDGVIMHYLSDLAKTRGESESVRELGESFAAAQEEETNRLIELAAGKGL